MEIPEFCDLRQINVTGIEEQYKSDDGIQLYAVALYCQLCKRSYNRTLVRGVTDENDAIGNAKSTMVLTCLANL